MRGGNKYPEGAPFRFMGDKDSPGGPCGLPVKTIKIEGKQGLVRNRLTFALQNPHQKMTPILIPHVPRDERIGSAFNHLFPIIHQTDSAADAVA